MIRNLNRGVDLAQRVVGAKRWFSRMRGMLGRRFDAFDAMVFEANNSVHTFFMGIAIDVVFVDREGMILSATSNLRPWRMAGNLSARTTIELPAGTIERTGTAVGDHLDIVIDTVL